MAWRSLGSAPVPLLGWLSALSPSQVMMALSMEELARRKKALARAALASRSFSSPHGELDTHRLYWALEKMSQKRNQSLEGLVDGLGPQERQLQPSAVESSVCWLWGRAEGTGPGGPALLSPCLAVHR